MLTSTNANNKGLTPQSFLANSVPGHLDHCIGFHEQRKHLRKVPLQHKG